MQACLTPPGTPPPVWTRRQTMEWGAVTLGSIAGFGTSPIAAATSRNEPPARCCIFVFLFGGPSHIDLWDMKPNAPAEIRGEFQPIATRAPGLFLCEHLPRLALQADSLCLLRSMMHGMNVHGPACSEVYSGRPYFGPPVTDQARPEDWPSIASLVMRFHRSGSGLPSSVVLPWHTQFVGQDRRIAGQTGGRMGEEWNPFLVAGDVTRSDYEVEGIRLPADVAPERLRRRIELLRGVQGASPFIPQSAMTARHDADAATAQQLIERAHATNAFALHAEPVQVRARYGPTRFGQSLLLARRLVERGIPLVTVNWDDDSRTDKVSPHWDTHHQNFPTLRDRLCPIFDQGFAALLADLRERGLLESTLVVAVGEFGRTPLIGVVTQNGMTEKTGRDHWPHAFTALLAGGGVRGGTVYGATNASGGYVEDRPVTPADLAATVLTHLGVDPAREYHDGFQHVERRLSEGTPIPDLS